MTLLTDAYRTYQHHVENLLSRSYREDEVSDGLERSLLDMRDDLTTLSRSLDRLEELFDQSEQLGESWKMYDKWSFDKLPELDQQIVSQLLPNLTRGEYLLELLNQVGEMQAEVSRRKKAFEEKVLAAWRKHHPRFSSMGIIDSSIQSETLKDTKPLARR